MKVQPTEKQEMDIGYTIPPAGIYVWQFDEGVDLYHKGNVEKIEDGRKSLGLPMIIDSVIEGDAQEGDKASHFIILVTKEGKVNTHGEEQLQLILTVTGLMETFASKFEGEVDPTSDKFMEGLKLHLPGKFIKARHGIRTYQGKDQFNIEYLSAVKSDEKVKAPSSDDGATEGW